MPHAEPAVASAPSRTNTVMVVPALAGIAVSLMQTLVIPQFPRLLSATVSDTTWAITATLLAGAVATPVVGRLGDMHGKHRFTRHIAQQATHIPRAPPPLISTGETGEHLSGKRLQSRPHGLESLRGHVSSPPKQVTYRLLPEVTKSY